MKKYIIFIAILCLSVASCKKDPLDATPDGRVSLETVFADNGQTAAYLNSAYSYLQPHGTYYFFWTMLAGFTDEAHDNDNPTEPLRASDWYNGALTPTYNPLEQADWNNNFYGAAWAGIRKANVFLSRIGTANVTNENDRKRWTAEAKVIRAYYYWELMKMYGPMPVQDKPFDLDFNFANLKRGTFDDGVQFIVKDCDDAIAEPMFPYRVTSENDRGRFTKALAYALKSEALLFNASPLWNESNDKAKWQAAATAAKEAITDLTANGYKLADDYQSYFITLADINAGGNPSDKETILDLKRGDVSLMSFVHGIPALGNFKAGVTPSQELVDSYEMANGELPIKGYSDADHLNPIINTASGYDDSNPYVNRDPRFYATVFYNGALWGQINGTPHNIESFSGGSDEIRNNSRQHTHNGYYLKKFVDVSLLPGQPTGFKWRQYRLAEIYLNWAEAENEANGPDNAYAPVNVVRARPSVNMPPLAGLSQDDFRIRIRNERRVELAFEENRFWDVRRWNILDKTDKLTTGMLWTKTGSTLTAQRFVVDRRLSWSKKFLLFPIPQAEISNLPSFDQNPDW